MRIFPPLNIVIRNNKTIEIARDVAKKLLEAQEKEGIEHDLVSISDHFDYPLVVGI